MFQRLTFVAVLLLATTEFTAAAELPADLGTRQAGVDWPRFLGPTGDSKSSEKGLPAAGPVSPLNIVWQLPLGAGYGMPVVSRGRLFQFDRHEDQARLRCLNSETGKLLWKYEYTTSYEDSFGYDNGPRCAPLVDDDRVYIFGVEGKLTCLNVADGKLVWQLDTADKFHVHQNFFGVGSTPVIEGDLLIAQIGGSPADNAISAPVSLNEAQPNGSGVVAFDKRSGEVKYKIANELASYAGPTLATIDGRRWCFVFHRGGLIGFDPANGKIDFEYPWRAATRDSVNASNPVVVDDLVFISECYGPGSSLLRVKPGKAEVVWKDVLTKRAKAMQTHWNTPIHLDGYLYGSSGRHTENAELRCIDFKTGQVLWSEKGLGRTSLLWVDGWFFCLGEHGELQTFKPSSQKSPTLQPIEFRDVAGKTGAADGAAIASEKLLEYPAWAAPILSHGLLYVRGKDRLVCLELMPDRAR